MSRTEFHDRISRISQTRPGRGRRRRAVSRTAVIRDRVSYPISFVAAFGLGLLSLAIVRLVRAQYFTTFGAEGSDALIMFDWIAAASVGLLIREVFRIRDRMYLPANNAGVFIGIVSMHNVLWWAPKLSVSLFGAEYAEHIWATTVPNSIIFRGLVFVG